MAVPITLLNINSTQNLTERRYNLITDWWCWASLKNSTLPDNFCSVKKLVSGGLVGKYPIKMLARVPNIIVNTYPTCFVKVIAFR